MFTQFNRQHPPSSIRETINWLLRLGRPPLPECPIEAAKQGKEPKAPCYFDGRRVIPISWKQWQKEQPIADIYQAWFSNPKTGIGTLGGWNGKHWLGWVDFDQKDFSSPEDCDARVAEWVERYPVMASAPMFRTPNGGYRFLVAFSREPENFKANSGFSLSPNGSHHVGELLTKNGGHTLLPPTVGVSGKAYRWERFCEYPPIVEQPEDVGLYPVQKRTEIKQVLALPTNQGNPKDNTYSALTDFLEREIYPRLSADVAFCWFGHDFKAQGDKLRGNCPWHESQSGTAFYVDKKDGRYLWRCPACEIGGSVIEYRHRLSGGNGSPRGRDFVDTVRQLASDVGVPMQAKEPRHQLKLHPDTILEIKQLADIVDVIGEHVVLSRRGKDFVGKCPFHDEKTPSFIVSPTKQTYDCLGCGAAGNVIKFLMELGKHSFSDVVMELARRYQVQARSSDGVPLTLQTLPLSFGERASGTPFVSAVSLRERVTVRKLSLEDAAERVKDVLQAKHTELIENIELEKVRLSSGMSSYDWERKIIKPIKRDMDALAFRLDLLNLLAIDDEVERIRQQAMLAPKYQMSSGSIDRALQLIKQRTTTPETQWFGLDDFFDLESEGLKWIIPELLPAGETIILAGPPKSGKTLLAIDAAFAVATGEMAFLKEAVTQGRVLIVSVDESAHSTKAKLIKRGFRRTDAQNVVNWVKSARVLR